VKELPDYNTSWQMVSLKEPVEEEVITWWDWKARERFKDQDFYNNPVSWK
jgi:hypothetical protein